MASITSPSQNSSPLLDAFQALDFCRRLGGSGLTELPPGIFDSLTTLAFLYVESTCIKRLFHSYRPMPAGPYSFFFSFFESAGLVNQALND